MYSAPFASGKSWGVGLARDYGCRCWEGQCKSCHGVVTHFRNLFIHGTDLYFLVHWLDEEDSDSEKLFDTLPSSKIISDLDVDVLNLDTGTQCKALFDGTYYDVEIVAKGESVCASSSMPVVSATYGCSVYIIVT